MKTYYYDAECGSIMLGTDTFKCKYHNGYGDGTFKLFIDDSEYSLSHFTIPDKSWHFIDTVEGIFNVYDYDCSRSAQVLVTLCGKYSLYCDNGNILIQRWAYNE